MSTRAHLVEPAGRTTASFDQLPPAKRDVSFVRVGALRLRISRQGQRAAVAAAGWAGEQPGGVGQPRRRASRRRHDRGRRPGHRVLLDSGAPALDGRVGRACTPVWCDLSGWRQVSVLGLSFGGAVAQQLAYQSPELVRRLVLCGTGPGIGGPPGAPAALQELASPARYYSAAQSRRVMPLIYGGRFAREPERFEP